MKKNILLFLLTSFSISALPQSTHWENISNQIPGDSLNILSDVDILDRWTSYVSSSSLPEIYRSDFWAGTRQTFQTPSPISALNFFYYDYGFICCTDSKIYQTVNAGESWNYFGSFGEKINDIDLGYDIYNLRGYVCGNNGTIGYLQDTNLTIINSGFNTDFIKICLPYNDKVWLVGDSSVYLYDGNTFIKQMTSDVKLNSANFRNELIGWAVGNSGYIAKTTDGGNTWIQKQNPDPYNRNLNDIYFVSNFGFAVGDDGLILTSYDSGETWLLDIGQLTINDLQAVHIAGGFGEWGPGLAVGKNRTALLYPIIVSVDDKLNSVDDFYLYQNYPNPFNPTTKIKYNVPFVETHRNASLHITLKLYDLLGNEIVTLVSEEKPAGSYEIEFNATGLPSGIYFYQLKAGIFIETKKMILLK